MEAVHNFALSNNRTLKVFYDQNPDSPRSWDNLSKMIFLGKHSHLGDKHEFHDTHESLEAHEAFIAKKLDVAYIARVYAYIHSGMTISLTPFSCRWDSGCLGWVVVTKEAIRNEYGVKRVTKKSIEKAIEVVKGEINVLDHYVGGDVYGFRIEDAEGNEEDSCWGFFGDKIEDNGILDYVDEEDRKKVLEQV